MSWGTSQEFGLPFYHFHFDGIDPDPVTCELPDLTSAKSEAAKTVGAMVCDAGASAWGRTTGLGVIVTDDEGRFLFEMIVAAFNASANAPASLPACA